MGVSELKNVPGGAVFGRRALLAAAMTATGLGIADLAVNQVAMTRAATKIDIGKMYRIRSALSTPENPFVLDVYSCLMENGRNIHLYHQTDAGVHNGAQMFHFKMFSDGSYSIGTIGRTPATENSIRGEYYSLDVAGGSFSSGTNIQLYEYNGTAAQRFFVRENGDGTISFVSCGNTAYAIDVAGGTCASETNIQLYASNGTPAQRFYLEEIPDAPETFKAGTESTSFSALLTDINLEDGSPEITCSGGAFYSGIRDIGPYGYKFDKSSEKWERFYSRKYFIPSESSVVTAIYPTVGTYYGRTVGVRSTFSDFMRAPSGEYKDNMLLYVPEYFSQADPGAMWLLGCWSVTQSVEFFYSDDPVRTPINIDLCYWTVDSLTNSSGGNFEYALPLESCGWKGHAYILPDYRDRMGVPTVVRMAFGDIAIRVDAYMAITTTLTDPDKSWVNKYCGVTFPYSGKTMKLRLGNTRREDHSAFAGKNYVYGGCLSAAFDSLWKQEETPVHFVVYDEHAAAEDPAYSPKEVFQAALQKGTKIDPSCDIVRDATRALLDAYPGARKGDDYWFESKDFDTALGTMTVMSDPIFIWARVSCGTVEFYADGIDEKHLVMAEANVAAGPYAIPEQAAKAAQKAACNLNERFDEDGGSGLTAWFTDPELTNPAHDLKVVAGRTLKLYARNRLTLRCAFTDDSVDTTELVLRTSPESIAPLAESWTLPDFGLSDERHAVDGIGLPAIGDDGPAHKALYLGESVTLARPMGRVYARMEDGTWAGFRAVAWLASQDTDSQITKVTPAGDTCVFMRVERADYDGVSSTKN